MREVPPGKTPTVVIGNSLSGVLLAKFQKVLDASGPRPLNEHESHHEPIHRLLGAVEKVNGRSAMTSFLHLLRTRDRSDQSGLS
jgi:hypothetical protein